MPGFTLRMVAALACLVLPFFFAGSGAAQALDPEQQRARAMLENLCGRCHAVGKTGKSPNSARPAIPQFWRKALRYRHGAAAAGRADHHSS